MSKPKVSIISTTYNHEKYIREALDSFVMQKTNFDFEVIIADDVSSDKTPQIIAEYAKAYPHIIKPILRKKNLGVVPNFLSALRAATGTYIAICEGDDYWTDPEKLQRQVDFLDNHPDYALCFHPARVFFENGEEKEFLHPNPADKKNFTLNKLLKDNFIQTNSVMYRTQNYDGMPEAILPLDWYLHLYHARFGKIGFIDRVMSAYRRHPGGIWWASHTNVDEIWQKYGIPYLNVYAELLKLYGNNVEHRKILEISMEQMFERLIGLDQKYDSALFQEATAAFPDYAASFVINLHRELHANKGQLEGKEHEVVQLRQTVGQTNLALQQRELEIKRMKASRFWKARDIMVRLTGK